jgi:hypothetical protein
MSFVVYVGSCVIRRLIRYPSVKSFEPLPRREERQPSQNAFPTPAALQRAAGIGSPHPKPGRACALMHHPAGDYGQAAAEPSRFGPAIVGRPESEWCWRCTGLRHALQARTTIARHTLQIGRQASSRQPDPSLHSCTTLPKGEGPPAWPSPRRARKRTHTRGLLASCLQPAFLVSPWPLAVWTG